MNRKLVFLPLLFFITASNADASIDPFYKKNPSCVIARGNPARTGVFKTTGLHAFHGIKWQSINKSYSTPICTDEYIISYPLTVYHFDDGKILWQTDEEQNSPPAYYKNIVYTNRINLSGAESNRDKNISLIGYDIKTGKKLLQFGDFTNINMLIYNDIAYISSFNKIVAFDLKKKRVIWKYDNVTTNGLSTDGNALYFQNRGAGERYALNLANGQLLWKNDDQYELSTYNYIVVYKQNVYYTFDSFKGVGIAALNKNTGKLVWKHVFKRFSGTFFNLAVNKDKVYVAAVIQPAVDEQPTQSSSNGLYAFNAQNGKMIWHTIIDPISSPSIAGNLLYIKTKDNIYAYDAETGKHKWDTKLTSFPVGILPNDIILHGNFIFTNLKVNDNSLLTAIN